VRLVDDTPYYMVYVDGSCLDNHQQVDEDSRAAWGFVVVTGDSGLGKGSGELFHESAGLVITDPSEHLFIGAELGTNNTAELSSFAAALRWLISEGGCQPACIRTDSQYAGHLATGEWKAKANRDLVAHIQSLWNEVSALRPLRWEHVRAHRGHRWNERADHIASRCAAGELPDPLTFWKPGRR